MTESVAPSPAKLSVWRRVVKLAGSAQARPVEVWLLRAMYAYLAVRLGIGIDHAA